MAIYALTICHLGTTYRSEKIGPINRSVYTYLKAMRIVCAFSQIIQTNSEHSHTLEIWVLRGLTRPRVMGGVTSGYLCVLADTCASREMERLLALLF